MLCCNDDGDDVINDGDDGDADGDDDAGDIDDITNNTSTDFIYNISYSTHSYYYMAYYQYIISCILLSGSLNVSITSHHTTITVQQVKPYNTIVPIVL